jgi:transcriptional regulator with XRE-family HTH domain
VVKYSSTVAFPVHGNPETLAINLRRLRQAAGLSQEELAHRADIDRTYISSIERQKYAASIEVVDSLAKGLGVEASELLQAPPAPDAE